MSVMINAKGTSVPFFKIGKAGVTLYQGTSDPSLAHEVSINDFWFDTVDGSIKVYRGSQTGWETTTASTAYKWAAARQLSFTGDVSGSNIVDGSQDVSFSLSLASTGVTPGSYTNSNITVDSKGRIISISNGSASGGVASVSGSSGIIVSGSTGDVTISTNATPNNTISTIVSRDASGDFSAGTITANLIGIATTAANILGGSAGNILYQSGSGSTSMLPSGNDNQVLIGGAIPSWTNAPWLDGTNFAYIPNSALINDSVTVGSTVIELGSTETTLAGLTSVTSNSFSALATSGNDSVVIQGRAGGTQSYSATVTPATLSANRTITLPDVTGTVVTTGDTGTVTSTMIADGTIVDADISSNAAIAVSKLAASTISGVTLGNNLNTLTIGTGLTGTSYNGSSAVTVAIDSSVVTTTGVQTLTNKTLSYADNTLTGVQPELVSGTNIKTINSQSILGSGNLTVSGGIEYVSKTSNYTALSNQGVLADTTAGSFTVTLPATPAAGAQVIVADSGGSWGTNNLTVGRNGSTIDGLNEDLVCDISGISVQFVYDGSTWEVYAQVGASGGTAVTLDGTQTITNKTISGGIYSDVVDITGSTRSNAVAVPALDIDCSLGNFFTKTINSNSIFTFSNAPAGKAYSFVLELAHTSGTVTWPDSVRWPNSQAPTLTTGKTHLFVFVTDNAGSTWLAGSNINYSN